MSVIGGLVGKLTLSKQGFNTVMRTAIAHAPVYLHITQSKDGDSDKYRIDQSTTANIPAVKEEWITDFEFRESKDPVMGRVRAKARWSEPRKIEDADFLADVPGGWFDEGKQQVEAFVESPQGGWTAHQVSSDLRGCLMGFPYHRIDKKVKTILTMP